MPARGHTAMFRRMITYAYVDIDEAVEAALDTVAEISQPCCG